MPPLEWFSEICAPRASLVSGIPHAGYLVQENDVVERIVEWAASPDAVAADKTAAALASIRKDVVSTLIP